MKDDVRRIGWFLSFLSVLTGMGLGNLGWGLFFNRGDLWASE